MSGARRPSARRAAVEASQHLERSASWNGLRAGDRVIVAGLHMRGADWEFRAHVLNRHNGTESIEVVGGRPGDRKIRSFGPDRIFAAMGAKGSRGNPERAIAGQPSLAEAPRLPFG
ncbi:MAG TPA: hypothetical protein VGY51_10450 [Acidimicrobiales bacterium]|nr:hypothetical protein [Acidimicrobiales bacterium]